MTTAYTFGTEPHSMNDVKNIRRYLEIAIYHEIDCFSLILLFTQDQKSRYTDTFHCRFYVTTLTLKV